MRNSALDTPLNDPSENHISVHASCDYQEDDSLGSVSPSIDMFDGAVHTAKVVYAPGTMTIFIDDLVTPLLEVTLEIGKTLSPKQSRTKLRDIAQTLDSNGKAWVGFTAATGGYHETHDILSWSFSPVVIP